MPLSPSLCPVGPAQHDADRDGRLSFREWCSYASCSDSVREFLAHVPHSDETIDSWDSHG